MFNVSLFYKNIYYISDFWWIKYIIRSLDINLLSHCSCGMIDLSDIYKYCMVYYMCVFVCVCACVRVFAFSVYCGNFVVPVETYMQIFGNSPGLTDQELTRRSVRSMHFYHEQWQQHQMEVNNKLMSNR